MLQECELIKGLLLRTRSRKCRRRTGGQLKACATPIKADLELRLLRTMKKGLGESL